MSITVRFDSFEKFKKLLKDLSQGMQEVVRETTRVLTLEAEHIAKERVRSSNRKPGKGTGAYFQSIRSEFREGAGSFIGSVESESPIAGIIEFGSRPHIIRPKGNKLLFWPGANHPAKEVKHPGTPAFRVLGDAVDEAALHTDKIFEKVLKKHFGP